MGTPSAGYVSDFVFNHQSLEGLQDATYDIQVATQDVTKKSSGGWDAYQPGNGSHSLSGTCVYEEDDPVQADMITKTTAKTEVFAKFRPLAYSSGNNQFVGHGFFTQQQVSSPNKEAISFPMGFQYTGLARRLTEYPATSPRIRLRSLDIDGNGLFSEADAYSDGDFIGGTGNQWDNTGSDGGNFYNSVSDATRPEYDNTLSANAYGAPGVRFTGASSELLASSLAASTYDFLHDGTDWHLFIVIMFDSTYSASDQPILATQNQDTSQSGIFLNKKAANTIQFQMGRSSGSDWTFNRTSSIAVPTDVPILLEVRHEVGGAGDDLQILCNEAAVQSEATALAAYDTVNSAADVIRMNTNPGGTAHGQGTYFHVELYNSVLSTVNRAALIQALKDDYGFKFEAQPA